MFLGLENKEIIVSEKVQDRENFNLQIDAVYCCDPNKAKNLSGEVLSKLFPVGNSGGFRFKGSTENPNYIVIYSSGEDIYWRDEIDNALGVFLYYGDNKTPGNDLHATKKGGNEILRNIFNKAANDDIEVRKTIPPVFVFQRHGTGRDMKFMGLAVPGLLGKPKKDWLTAVWGCDKTGNRFLNYKAYFTILDTANLGNGFDSSICLGWLDDLEKSNGFLSKYAPEEWKKFILGSKYRALATKMERYVKSKEEQLPSTKADLDMLQTIHDFFIEKDNGYSFEPFAADIVEAMDYQVEEINVTNPYKDGGFDAIGKYKVFKASQNEVLVDFYMQAKCYSLDNSIGVKDTARLIARVKDRQFGILFTTSYVANQAFTEIFEDCHPIVIISGKNITDYFHNELEIHDKEGVLEYLKKKYSE